MSRTTLAIVLLALAACDQANNNPANPSGKPGAPADSKQTNSGVSSRGEAELPSLERLTGDTDRVPDVMNGLVAHIYAIRPNAEEIAEGWGYGISGKAKKSDSQYERQIYEHAESNQFVSTSFERANSVSKAEARLNQWMGRNPRNPVADLGDEAYRFTRRPAIYFRRANVVVKVSCSGKTSEGSLIPVAKAIDQRIQTTLNK